MSTSASDLPAWTCGDKAVPLRGWRDSELAALARSLGLALRTWQAAWGLTVLPASVHCAAAEDGAAAAEWLVLGAAGTAAGWVALEPSFEEAVSRQLWGAVPTTSPIARQVQARCHDELLVRLAQALGIERGGTGRGCRSAAPTLAWSGSVDATLAPGARVRMNGELACKALRGLENGAVPPAHARGPRSPLLRVDDAVAGSSLDVRVHLADCELAVGSLQDLRIGDVVRLEHAVDAPLEVRDPEGRAVFCGFLARSRGFKAVELALLAPAGAHLQEKVLP